MEIVFQKANIEEAASAAKGISSENNTNPVLANVLIIAKENEDKVEIKGSNGDAHIRCFIPATIKEPGCTTIPAVKFHQIIAELPNADVVLKFDGTKVIITCGVNTYKLAILPPDDFPKYPEMEVLSTVEVAQKPLKRAIDGALFSVAIQEPRKVLLGALFDLNELILRVVSTDGRKLSYSEIDVTEVSGQTVIKAVVPQKILSEVTRFLREEGSVKVSIAKNQISFEFSNFSYISNLIDGVYPNYQNVIPKEFAHVLSFDSDQFASALKLAAILTDEKSYGVIMRFSQGKVEMQTNTSAFGSFDGYANINYEGEVFTMAFNYKNCFDVLRLLGKSEVELKIKGIEMPAIFSRKGETRSFFIIMPIKMSEITAMMNTDEESDDYYSNDKVEGGSDEEDEWQESSRDDDEK